MADIVSTQKRSEMMAGIKGKNTNPEIFIRKALYSKGFRYRLHNRKISGNPDIVLSKYNTLIFINGCFWHGHQDCHLFRFPKSKTEFWEEKIGKNIERDHRNYKLLVSQGWKLVIVWECALKGRHKTDVNLLINSLEHFITEETQKGILWEIRSSFQGNVVSTIEAYGESLH